MLHKKQRLQETMSAKIDKALEPFTSTPIVKEIMKKKMQKGSFSPLSESIRTLPTKTGRYQFLLIFTFCTTERSLQLVLVDVHD